MDCNEKYDHCSSSENKNAVSNIPCDIKTGDPCTSDGGRTFPFSGSEQILLQRFCNIQNTMQNSDEGYDIAKGASTSVTMEEICPTEDRVPGNLLSVDMASSAQPISPGCCNHNQFKYSKMMFLDAFPNVAAYWDIENCPVPKMKSVRAFVKKVRDSFYEGFVEEEFVVVCDVLKESKVIVQELNYAQVEIEHVIAHSKNAADEKLRHKIRNFAEIAKPSSRVILITSDINFIGDIRFLRYKKKLDVILIHNKQINSAMLDFANVNVEFEEFAQDLPFRNIGVSNDKMKLTSLLVKNLPRAHSPNTLKSVLSRTFDNCGGKIAELKDYSPEDVHAIMKFRCPDDAIRAKNRFDGVTVLGRKIRIEYLSDSPMAVVDNDTKMEVSTGGKGNQEKPTLPAVTPTVPSYAKPCWLVIMGEAAISEAQLKQTLDAIGVRYKSFTFSYGNNRNWVCGMTFESMSQGKRYRKVITENLEFQVTIEVLKQPCNSPLEVSTLETFDRVKFREEFLAICNQNVTKHHKKKTDLVNKLNLLTFEEQAAIQQVIHILDAQLSEFQKSVSYILLKLENSSSNPIYLRSLLMKECRRLDADLPIYALRNNILDAFKRQQIMLITGPSGAGKSTQVVQYVMEENFGKTKCVVVEPNKICVLMKALCVCNQFGFPVKVVTLSYQELREFKEKATSKILFTTDEMLLKEYRRDPYLKFCDCLIMDELQERSDFGEILLPLLKTLVKARPDLKLILISSVERCNALLQYFSPCEMIQIPATTYPVQIMWIPPAANRSMREHIIEVVMKVLQETREGNILAFFPDTFDILVAQTKLKQCNYKNVRFIPIYSDVCCEDFFNKPSSTRKVFLSTFICQSAINLPNICFVIDCGIKRRFWGNAIYNEFISKTEAMWRMMKAGGKLGGKCYRCYSENDLTNAPEFVCWKPNVERLLLHVLCLVGPSIEQFSFVEPITAEHSKIAWKTLSDIRAVSANHLTSDGQQMTALPLRPRLAVLVIEAMKNDDVPLSYVLFLVSIMSMYEICPEIRNSQSPAENKFPNLLELLKSFVEWCSVNTTNMMKWFEKSKIDKETSERICDHIMELFNVIKNEFNFEMKRKYSQHDWFFSLQQLLMKCWNDSLSSMYQSSQKTYLNIKSRSIVNLLPQNAFAADPVYVVYEKVIEDSQHKLYMINPLPIDILLVGKNIGEETLLYQPCYIRFVGSHLLENAILGPNKANLNRLLVELQAKINDCKVNIEVNQNAGEIVILIWQKYHAFIQERIGGMLAQAKQKMLEWTFQFEVSNSVYFKVELGPLGNIKKCLHADECNMILIQHPNNVKVNNVLTEIKKFGNIIRYHRQKTRCSLIVEFSNAAEAEKALREFKKYNIRELFPQESQKLTRDSDSAIKVTWVRRENCRCATVNFALEANRLNEAERRFRQLIMKSNFLENVVVVTEASKHRILLRNLNPLISRQELVSFINSVCNKIGLPTTTIDIPLTKAFPTTDEYVKVLSEKLFQLIRAVDSKVEKVEVSKPKDKDELWMAHLIYSNPSYVSAAMERLNQGIKLDSIPLKFQSNPLTAVFHCSCDVREAIFNPLRKALTKFSQTLENQREQDLKISTNTDKGGESASFEVTASLLSEFIKYSRIVSTFIQGEEMSISKLSQIYLANSEGKQKLEAIAKEESVLIKADTFCDRLYFWGSAMNINRAMNKLERLLAKLKSECCQQWNEVFRYGDVPGFLSCLLREYGIHMIDLCKQTGCIYVEFNILDRSLKMCGNRVARTKFLAKLNSMKKQFLVQTHDDSASVDICPVCLAKDVNNTKHYRLEYCGHAYCFPCFSLLLANGQIPLNCIDQTCCQPFVSLDFSFLAKEFCSDLNRMIRKELVRLSTLPENSVVFCPTPLCGEILVFSSPKTLIECPMCQNWICLRCRRMFHYGQKCDDLVMSDLLEEFQNKFMI